MKIETLINEALGEFPQQYELAREIAAKAISMVKTHDRNNTFEAMTKSQFKKFIITIEYSEDDPNYKNMMIDMRPTTGSFDGVNSTTVGIKYFIARIDVMKQDYEKLENKLYYIAVHELNHGYVIWNQAKYNQVHNEKFPENPKPLTNPLPDWYEPILNVISKHNSDDITKRFAQALYACHEKEFKAIISQTTPYIANTLSDRGNRTRADFIKAMKNCEPYKRFYEGLYEVLPEARMKKEELVLNLKEYETGIDESNIDEFFEFVQRRCEIGLKYVEKNAMLYFHEHIKFGNTDWFKKHPLKKK